jgi:hypothetical protein
MKTDFISRLAATLLAFLFVSNDLAASTHALFRTAEFNTLEESTYEPLNYFDHPGYQNIGIDDEYTNAEPETPAIQTKQPMPTAGLNAEAIDLQADHQSAYLGAHAMDKTGNPGDDIFTISIAEPIDKYTYAVLRYEVNGVAQGESLPKTINGRTTYGSTALAKGNNWQHVEQRIDVADLRSGENFIAFGLPRAIAAGVEVKNVGLHLTNMQPLAIAAAKMPQMEANPIHFHVDAADLNKGYKAFALQDYEMASVPRSIVNVSMGAQGYRLVSNKHIQEPIKISMSVDPARMLGTSNMKEVQLFFFNTRSKRWETIVPENIDMATFKLEATVPGNSDYFAGMIKTPEMPEAAAYVPTAISDIEAANPAAGMNLMSPPDISHTGEASIHYPLAIPQGRQGMTPQLALTYNSDAGTGWMGMGWNVSIPQVSIDTRWGVPRFDSLNESEVYVINGQSLSMQGGKKANRAKIVNDSVQPNPRIGNAFFFEKTRTSYKEVERREQEQQIISG